MVSIYRVESGLIFEDGMDTFDNRWGVSPSNSYTHREEDKMIRLHHSDRGYTTLMMEIPEGEDRLMFEVRANYYPQLLGDEGGIVVWKNALEKLEFFESMDTTQEGDYTYWRAVKNKNLWSFFANKDGSWELFDSAVILDPNFMGIALSGVKQEGYADLGIRKAMLCRGRHVEVGNVHSGYKVQLLDSSGIAVSTQTVPDGYSGVEIDLPWIPFMGGIKIIDPNAAEGVEPGVSDILDIYGGDKFVMGTDLTIFWRGKELDAYNPTNIGAMKNNNLEEKMSVVNNTSGSVAESIVIKLAIYKESFGWEWVDLAPDLKGSPGTYADSITMGDLQSGEHRDFWVKVTRGTEFSTKPVYFMLDIRNQ